MTAADITDIRFMTNWLASIAREKDAKERARRDITRIARARVACRITILSEWKDKRKAEEGERGGAA